MVTETLKDVVILGVGLAGLMGIGVLIGAALKNDQHGPPPGLGGSGSYYGEDLQFNEEMDRYATLRRKRHYSRSPGVPHTRLRIMQLRS